MPLDFTLNKYKSLCEAILNSQYTPVTVEKYLKSKFENDCVIFRHDVDKSAKIALKMAELESNLGIKSTYYFRMKKKTFVPEILSQIQNLGHEVGYHYEVLDKSKGDYALAMSIFEAELNTFREYVDVETICMHGNPLSKWTNKDIWSRYSLEEYNLIGEAYLSIDYNNVEYFTDTGRTWNEKYSLKDHVTTGQNHSKVDTTDNLINLINVKKLSKICINTHPKRWNDKLFFWANELITQTSKNCIKKSLKNKLL